MALQENLDPFLHYLEAGRPSGPWSPPLITPGQAFNAIGTDIRVALHIHVHYPELLDQIIEALAENQLRPSLYITTSHQEHVDTLHSLAEQHDMAIEKLIVVPNRGRDIGPLITELGRHLDRNYAFYGHLHTKKSVFIEGDSGKIWRDYLIANLLGDSMTRMADRIVAKMNDDPHLGLVFPDDPNCMGWGKNDGQAKLLAHRLALKTLPEAFNFPIGNMFWARQGALAPLYDLNMGWEDYPSEPLPYDGTLLHAIERIIPLVNQAQGYSYSLTHVPGVYR